MDYTNEILGGPSSYSLCVIGDTGWENSNNSIYIQKFLHERTDPLVR